MYILFFVLLFFSIAFLIPYLVMLRIKIYKFKVMAKVLSLEEGTKVMTQQKSQMEFYYPIMKYEYSYNEQTYTGQTTFSDIKRLMVPAVDHLGEPAKDEKFIWRQCKVGDEVPVLIDESKPHKSLIGYESNEIFVFQRKGYLVLSSAFFVLAIITLFFILLG